MADEKLPNSSLSGQNRSEGKRALPISEPVTATPAVEIPPVSSDSSDMVEAGSTADEVSSTPKSASHALTSLRQIMSTGMIGIILFAIMNSRSTGTKAVAVGMIAGGGALLAGGLLGFLFGIPRTTPRSETAPALAGGSIGPDQPPLPAREGYQPNTNLEEISDWLTKIFVGVGLTQIEKVPGAMMGIGTFLGPGFGTSEGANAFAVVLVLFYFIAGFLYGFLWTRLYLGQAFREADLAAMGRIASTVSRKAVEDQDQRNAGALLVANRQFSLNEGEADLPQDVLDRSIATASPATKIAILNHAQEIRSRASRDKSELVSMERTIPVFRSLIAADPDATMHRPRGNLGFALKDKKAPDWAEAEKQLTDAIKIRDKNQEFGWVYYELRRALCRIARDVDFQAGVPSKPTIVTSVLADLKVVARQGQRDAILKEKDGSPTVFNRWAEINKINVDELNKP